MKIIDVLNNLNLNNFRETISPYISHQEMPTVTNSVSLSAIYNTDLGIFIPLLFNQFGSDNEYPVRCNFRLKYNVTKKLIENIGNDIISFSAKELKENGIEINYLEIYIERLIESIRIMKLADNEYKKAHEVFVNKNRELTKTSKYLL